MTLVLKTEFLTIKLLDTQIKLHTFYQVFILTYIFINF